MLSTVWAVVQAGVALFRALWPVIKIVGMVMLVLVGATLLVVGIFIALGAAVLAVIGLIVGVVVGGVGAIIDAFSGMPKGTHGAVTQWGMGLIGGIMSFFGAAGAAAASVAGAVVDGFKSALQIRSPSRVMMKLGGYTAEGFTEGVDDGAADAKKSMERMAAPPKKKPGDKSGAADVAGGGLNIDLRGAVFYGCDESSVRALFHKVFGELAGAAGALKPAGAT